MSPARGCTWSPGWCRAQAPAPPRATPGRTIPRPRATAPPAGSSSSARTTPAPAEALGRYLPRRARAAARGRALGIGHDPGPVEQPRRPVRALVRTRSAGLKVGLAPLVVGGEAL